MDLEIKQIMEVAALKCGDRYTYNGKNVPRVTEIISKMIHEDAITQWANSLGFKHKSYTKTLNEAAVYGTHAHYGIECYLKKLPVPEETPGAIIGGFCKWWDVVTKNNTVKVLGQEHKLTCEWFGGTYDALIEINGEPYLVDFKTSNHVTYKYYLQLAAYRYTLREKEKIDPVGLIILQLSKQMPSYNEYVLNLKDPKQLEYIQICERTFFALMYGYYHIHWLEAHFNEITNNG